jgi:hypothetical protein
MRINIIRAAAAGALLMGPICLEGKALTALSNLANVVDGKIFFDAGGALRLRSRMYVSDDGTAHEAISPSNIEDLSYDQNYKGSSTVPLINSVSVKSTPLEIPFIRTHLDGVSLFISTISVDGQEIRNIAGNSGKFYNDDEFYPYAEYPTSYDMPPLYISYPANTYLLPSSVSGINPAFKIFSSKREEPGNNLTYGTGIVVKGSPVFSSEKFTLTLQNPNNYYVKFDRLELSGVFAQPGRSILSEHKDSDSIALYGRRDAEVDNNFIPDEVAARNRAEWAILSGKDLADIFTVDLMHGMPWMELGDTESLVEDITNMQPTTRNLVIRRLNWKYSEKSYTESHVIVPPAPVMTISTTIAGVDLVANNCKRSALQDSIPYSAISGVGKQVGLNTIPAFSQLTGSSREILSPSTYTYPTTGICYYRGFAFVCYAPGGYIQRIDPINMTVLNTWKIGDGRGFGSIKTHGNIAYIVDQDGSGGDTDRIIWVDLDRLINSPATLTQGTDWDVKIVTHDIPSMSLFVRGALEIYGDKLYCHCIRTNSPWYSRLIRVDVSNTNLVTEPEISIDTGNINSVVYANELTRGDGFIWAISPSYGSDYTLASEATAGTDTMTLTGTPTWIEGDVVRFSGVYEDATVKTVNGTTVTFDRPLVYTHAAGATVSKANTQIALINESDGTLNKIINLRDGSSGCGLEWHDGYIFVSYNDRVVKYAYDGTNMLKVGEYRPVGKYSSTGTLVFDGTYIWWVRAGQIIQLNPRGCFPVAIFTTRSYLGGTGIFTGTHMICTGSKANQGNSACYVVPRIASQSI